MELQLRSCMHSDSSEIAAQVWPLLSKGQVQQPLHNQCLQGAQLRLHEMHSQQVWEHVKGPAQLLIFLFWLVQVDESEQLLRYACSGRVLPLMTTRLNAQRCARLVQQPIVASVSDSVWNFASNSQTYVHRFPQFKVCAFPGWGSNACPGQLFEPGNCALCGPLTFMP